MGRSKKRTAYPTGETDSKFTEYWQESAPYIKGLVSALVYSANDRNDVIQNIAEAAWRIFSTFNPGKSPFRKWLSGIARIEYLKYMRSINSDRNVFDTELLDSAERIEEQESDSRRKIYQNIDKCMGILPEDRSSLLKMKYYRKMSIAEIAGVLKISEAAVKERLYRTRKELKTCLREHM